MNKLTNFLSNKYRYLFFSIVITNLIAIIFSAITIVFWQYKIVLTFTILLIPMLYILFGYLLHSFICLKLKKMELNDKKTWLNLDSIFFCILMIVGFGLIGFNFSTLFILILLCLSFCYLSISYNYRKSIVDDLFEQEKDNKNEKNKKR